MKLDEPTDHPFWMAGNCPPWCAEEHRDSDHPADRAHRSTETKVDLTQELGIEVREGTYEPDGLGVTLYQRLGSTPTVPLTQGDQYEVTLTLDEAERLANAQWDIVVVARDALAQTEEHR